MANTFFQVNGSDIINYFVPKDVFSQGQLWGWGNNSDGNLGDNTTTARSSPVQTIAGGVNWKQVSGGYRSSIAIKTDGTLWAWGFNGEGTLGTNNTTSYSSPVQTIAAGTNWKQVSCFRFCVAAIKTDGTLWLWGDNGSGQLGTNNITKYSSPVQTVSGGTNWRQVSCGGSHTAAIKTDGTLWLWGAHYYGELGNNATAGYPNARSSPVQTVSGGTNWKLVSCGDTHTGAIKTDGTLWLWGDNGDGQLGDNTLTSKSSPIQTVAGGTNWKQVSCGSVYTGAIKTDGTLWMWGDGTGGKLGNNLTFDRSSPVQTVSAGINWRQVSCGFSTTGAIKTDGTLWMWGVGTSGELGDNTRTSKSSPVQTIAAGTNWKDINTGHLTFISAITAVD